MIVITLETKLTDILMIQILIYLFFLNYRPK